MAARGDPNVPGSAGVGWPAFASSPNGSVLLIEGGAGEEGTFREAGNFMQRQCDLIDSAALCRAAAEKGGGAVLRASEDRHQQCLTKCSVYPRLRVIKGCWQAWVVVRRHVAFVNRAR